MIIKLLRKFFYDGIFSQILCKVYSTEQQCGIQERGGGGISLVVYDQSEYYIYKGKNHKKHGKRVKKEDWGSFLILGLLYKHDALIRKCLLKSKV